jgi:hypothetical protein
VKRRQQDEVAKSTRSCNKLIRFSPTELDVVNERARAAGQPVACYIRDASLGSRKKMSSGYVVSADLIRGLARAATHLCLLRDAATTHSLPDAARFAMSVDELLELIRQLD